MASSDDGPTPEEKWQLAWAEKGHGIRVTVARMACLREKKGSSVPPPLPTRAGGVRPRPPGGETKTKQAQEPQSSGSKERGGCRPTGRGGKAGQPRGLHTPQWTAKTGARRQNPRARGPLSKEGMRSTRQLGGERLPCVFQTNGGGTPSRAGRGATSGEEGGDKFRRIGGGLRLGEGPNLSKGG